MSTEITITSTTIDINVTESPITIEAPSGAYPLPTSVYSVFGRTGNIVATEGDYTLTQLAGVTITSPISGQALVYNGTSWVNNTETYVGTVTNVAALTIGTTGTDLTSSVVNSTTTPVITLNVPTASASNRGALSSADWSTFNAKQPALNGTGFVKISGTTISYDNSTYYLASNPSFYIPLTALSSTATGLTYTNTTGVFSTTAGYGIPTTAKQTTWDTAYNDSIVSAAVTGTTTKTLTLNQQDGGTVTASWTDDNTDAVTSVFGRTGAVVAVNGDYSTSLVTEGTNLYYTDVRARASNSFVAGSGAYNSTTGVITIPTNNNQITNGAAYITLTGLSATAPLSYSNTTGIFSISQATSSVNGYLTSTDWNTFNNKENAISTGTTLQYWRGDKSWQTLDTTAVVEATNLYYTQARFNSAFAAKTTTDLTEGINLYYTDARARAAITGTSPISVTAGVVSITQSSASANGYLSSTDWSTFNNKQNQLNGTGFVKASGTTITYDNSTYLTTIEGITAGGELSGTYTSPSLVNSAVTGKVLTGVNVTGGSISATDSILTAFGKVQNQINGLIGGSIYKGTWNASTNTPTLASGVGTAGNYYIVSVAGTTNLDGITDWQVGDWAIFQGSVWQKVDNTDAVVSVNGFTGAVSLTTSNINEGTNLYFTNARTIASSLTGYTSGAGTITSSDTILTAIQKLNGNISSIVSGVSSVFGRTGAVVSANGDYTTTQVTEGTNLYYTDARVRASLSFSAGSGAYNSTTGVITIPTNNNQITNGAGYITTADLTGYIPYTGATTAIDLNAQSVVNISHLGINTTSVPTILLRVVGDNNSNSRIAIRGYSSNANSSSIRVTKFRGSAGTPQAPLSGDSLGKFELAGYGTTSSEGYPQASFEGLATENWGATARGTKTVVKVTPNTTINQVIALTINQDKSAVFESSITGTSLIKTGGTSSQFLKADGTVDSSSYITLASLSATSPLLYNNTTGVFSIQQSSGSQAGYLSAADWTTFNGKESALTFSSPLVRTTNTISIPAATTSVNGYLTSTDWTTFNNKQSALTNPVTGTGTTNYLPKFTGTSTIGNSLIWDNGTNVGIGNTNTSYTLDVSGTGRFSGVLTLSSTISNGTYTYTLPGATGTLALTSALSGYLPLSGGTLTGALNGTSATFSSSVTATSLSINTSGQARTFTTFYGAGSDGNNIFIGGGGLSSGTGGGASYLGSYNTANGVQALYSNTTGYQNTANGFYALAYNTTGYNNTANGFYALLSNTTGYQNTANGESALYSNTTGNYNTANGVRAGYGTGTNANTTGSNNIFIGYLSVGVSATESNRTWIGNSSTTSTWLAGNVLIGNTTDNLTGAKLQVTGAATFSSSVTANSYVQGTCLSSTNGDAFRAYASASGGAGSQPGIGYYTSAGSKRFINQLDVTGDTWAVTGTTGTNYLLITQAGAATFSSLAGATSSRAVLADTAGTLSAPVSDISVKQNIKPIGYGLTEILKMNPVWFDFIDEYKNYGVGRQNGNIAQEMEKIIPEAVFTTPSTGKMGIEYSQLHAVYIKAIQEQQIQIQNLQEQNQDLKSRLDKAGL